MGVCMLHLGPLVLQSCIWEHSYMLLPQRDAGETEYFRSHIEGDPSPRARRAEGEATEQPHSAKV